MTDPFTTFGKPDRFAIEVRWREDSEPLARRPAGYGWSVGDLRLIVAGKTLTRHRRGAAAQTFVSWYLFPVLQWLADHWIELLHEEDFSWPERSAQTGAVASSKAMAQWMASGDQQGRRFYQQAQAWRRRHALRSSANGGLFPDIVLRRYLDTIEVSWTNAEPAYAGEGFSFMEDPGVAYIGVGDVAKPLWALLRWCEQTAPVTLAQDKLILNRFSERLAHVEAQSNAEFEDAYAPAKVMSFARAYLRRRKIAPAEALRDVRVTDAPAIHRFSAAVAMFGGVEANLEKGDVETLTELLVSSCGGADSDHLAGLVEDAGPPPSRAPHVAGQQRALELLDELKWTTAEGFVDVRAMAAQLGVQIVEKALETDAIRGVALAGEGLCPTILVNLTSFYNSTEPGRRFSIAHELCHILYDRSFARRVAVSSGPWAPPGVEKRANAFAAMLLMPASLVASAVGEPIDRASVSAASLTLQVSEQALVEHIFNIGRIGESERDHLRASLMHG